MVHWLTLPYFFPYIAKAFIFYTPLHLQLSVLKENMTVEIKQIECLVPWLYISQFRTNFLNFCGLHYVSLAKKEFQPLYLKLMLITSIVHAL